MTFFPTQYPDELLYSVFARYHIRTGNTSSKNTIKEIFETTTATAVVDLPCNLEKVIKNMPIGSEHTVEELIYNNTLFPYYNAFLPHNRAIKVLKSIRGVYGGDIHTRVGIVGSTITTNKFMKYCFKCNAEDKEKYGELYWHRLFQLPGVLACPKHEVLLNESSVPFKGINKHEYIAASEESCKKKPLAINHNSNDLEELISIAKEIAFLLENKLLNHSYNWFSEKYKNLLIEKELATVTGRVNQVELVNSFSNFYSKELLALLESIVDYDYTNNWLSSIVRKHRNVFHPIRHILLIKFLGTTVENFFQEKALYQPFGTGPWPCLNRASDHYHKLVVDKTHISQDFDTKQPVGTFYCNCGFVFSRRGPDKSEKDRYRIGRIKVFGPIWEEKLKIFVEAEKYSLREIGRKLNVDVKTVKKYSGKLLSNNNSKGNITILEAEKIEKKVRRRKLWLDLQINNKELSKNELRQLDKALYMWLFKNDKEWLNSNSPRHKIIINPSVKLDWNIRDEKILKDVKAEVDNIFTSNGKPIRITISNIGKKLGFLSMLEKNLAKLPYTKEYLLATVESAESFQIRRVKWAVRELINKNGEAKEWQVLKMAGIRDACSEKINKTICDEIYLYSLN
ncbi:TnsD family transposase [Clostridium sp. CS001]|uniref:TnsD family transposase n=1 Tax=Clostridium sp. CS001 TaxID=2880648 RepID=UPI001CF42981|nr:TnsD family transposase [Clostridium sp. CS001]MCB2291588.1 TnsD family transposase [Clostridium sp. CS001]